MKYYRYLLIILLALLQNSCNDFVEIDVPNDRIISETVFNKNETAKSAVIGIYNELFNSAFSSGFQNSITVLAGLSADNLEATVTTATLLEFEENEIFINNSYNQGLWSSAYNIIYMTNAVLEGLDNNPNISQDLKERLTGEARFIRAFTYFYLVNLYGDVPLVISTDYSTNAKIPRSNQHDVYTLIVEDLENAQDLLEEDYQDGERLRANRYTTKALLARVHLYLENWETAEQLSTEVISATELYELLPLNSVFLANSREAIWQISPLAGGSSRSNTNEGDFFLMLDNRGSVALTENFLTTFDTIDARMDTWVGSFESETDTYYFPYKYKIKNSVDDFSEYSMVLRLAEQYLIRSEALAKQGRLTEAIEDLDRIRQRAGLPSATSEFPEVNQEQLIELILLERRRELFTEWGHRWLDLKRTEMAREVLPPLKPLWDNTDVLYPIPEDELKKNPNLTQNPGY